MKRLWTKIKTYISPFLNWRILVIYVPIWFIMSGWTYLFIYLGTKYHIGWMLASGTFWATVLWLPITPEKLITIPLTILVYVKWVGRGNKDTVSGQLQCEKLEAMVVEAHKDWNKTKTHLVAIYRKTCQWFKRNYHRLIKTLIVVLITILLLLGLLLM